MKKLLFILALLLVFLVAYAGDHKVKHFKDLSNCVFEGAIAKYIDGEWTCATDIVSGQAQIDALEARVAANEVSIVSNDIDIAKNASGLAFIHP